MREGFRIGVVGPFTLRLDFSLTKDGREDVGNLLLDTSQTWSKKFDTLDDAISFLQRMGKEFV